MSKRAMETWLEGRTDATMICGDSERLPLSIWTFRNALPSLSYRPWSGPERARNIGLLVHSSYHGVEKLAFCFGELAARPSLLRFGLLFEQSR